MHRFLRNASANSQLPNGPAEPPAPTELRRIRTALQSSTAKLIYRTHSNATICNSSCTVTGGAYHSARRVSPCVRNGYKTGASLNRTRSTHQTVPQRPFSPLFFSGKAEKKGPPEARRKRPRRNESPLFAKPLFLLRVYLKTPNAPGQRAFLRCAASFFLEIRQYSCEKMSCATQKSLAAGHIMSFQIHPSVGEKAKNHVYYHRHPETFMLGCQIKPRNLEGQLHDGQQIRSRVFHVSGQTRKNRGNQ